MIIEQQLCIQMENQQITLPDGKYELTEESYCTNEENVKDESITLSYDSATQGLLITPMNKKGTKCYLYFEEQKPSKDVILAVWNRQQWTSTLLENHKN